MFCIYCIPSSIYYEYVHLVRKVRKKYFSCRHKTGLIQFLCLLDNSLVEVNEVEHDPTPQAGLNNNNKIYLNHGIHVSKLEMSIRRLFLRGYRFRFLRKSALKKRINPHCRFWDILWVFELWILVISLKVSDQHKKIQYRKTL